MRKQIMAAAAVLIAALGFTGAARAQPVSKNQPVIRNQPISNCTTPPSGSVALPQHYLSYTVTGTQGFTPPPPSEVTLKNKISGTFHPTTIGAAIWHWNPACKFRNGETNKILNKNVHYLCFSITAPTQHLKPQVVTDQFVSDATLKLGQPDALCLPSWKSLTGPPTQPGQPKPADHYTCYPVENPQGSPVTVQVQDEFTPNNPVGVTVNPPGGAQQLCAPTQKTVAGKVYKITNPSLYYWCRAVTQTPTKNVFDKNQFGVGPVTIEETNFLCVPASIS